MFFQVFYFPQFNMLPKTPSESCACNVKWFY